MSKLYAIPRYIELHLEIYRLVHLLMEQLWYKLHIHISNGMDFIQYFVTYPYLLKLGMGCGNPGPGNFPGNCNFPVLKIPGKMAAGTRFLICKKITAGEP